MGKTLLHKRSSVKTNGSPKLPQPSQLEYGEIAINFVSGDETIAIKNSSNEIAEFKTYEKTVSGLVASVTYDSNEKKILFYDKSNNQLATYVDATDFIKDGMLSGVTVSGSNLVMTFNTDAGKEDISLSLTQIFNPSNYYTKTDIDEKNYISGYTETDPIFTGSPAYNISQSDITNWNSKTDNTGTITGIQMNGDSVATAGTANLGTVVTGVTVNGDSAQVSNGVVALTMPTGLPAVTSSNNGMVLKVVNGAWAVVSAVTVYSGTGEPESTLGHNGDIFLKV